MVMIRIVRMAILVAITTILLVTIMIYKSNYESRTLNSETLRSLLGIHELNHSLQVAVSKRLRCRFRV